MKHAYVFPGQGAQAVGMGKDLYDNVPAAKELFEKANEILGFRITDIMFAGTDEELKQTRVTQPAVFLHSVIMAKALGVKPDAAAGHSLGEFSALVVAGSLSFEDGLKLVSKRAMAMQAACEAQPGTMAAILGLEDKVVEEICASVDGVVVEGIDSCLVKFARCCTPIPGDEIVGFITQGRGISVHRADCDQLAELQSHAPERIVDAVWGESYSAGYSLVVRVEANDRSGLLRDITTILANEKVNVLGVASRSDTRQQLATIDMTIEIYNLQVLGRVLGKLNQVPDVIDARRLHGG